MTKFTVNVKETYLRVYEVEADSVTDAIDLSHSLIPTRTCMTSREVIACYGTKEENEEDWKNTLSKMDDKERKPN